MTPANFSVKLQVGLTNGILRWSEAVGFVKEIEIEADCPGVRLTRLFHGAWNLAPDAYSNPLPCRFPVGREFSAERTTFYEFESDAIGTACIRLVLSAPDAWYAARLSAERIHDFWRPGTPCPNEQIAIRDHAEKAQGAIRQRRRAAAEKHLTQAEEAAKAVGLWDAHPISVLIEAIRAALPGAAA